jgi:hypothetical protein
VRIVNSEKDLREPDRTSTPGLGRRRLKLVAEIATVLGTVIAALALVLSFWSPFGGGPSNEKPTAAEAAGSTAPVSASAIPASPAAQPVAAGVYLNTIEPDRGRQNLAALPDKLPSTVDRVQALTIGCPSNQTGDQVREITYALDQRYLSLEATVVASFDPAKYWRVGVVPLVGISQRDGTVQSQERGAVRGVTMTATGQLSVAVKGAQEVTLQITCERPNGVVVLAGARLTKAN